ncbi:MAG TPA: MFS transporter [Pyrinomonadaceae bacterium]|jgi:fucose permease
MTNLNAVRFLKVLLHAGFFASGVATVFIGQILPLLAAKFSLGDRQAGDFFICQLSGSLLGTLTANRLGRAGKFVFAASLGCFLMASGIALLNSDSVVGCFAGFFLNGFGIGLTLPAINMLTLELNPRRAASALNIVNFFWGVGAISSQPIVDFFSRGASLFRPTAVLSAGLLTLGAAIALVPKETEQKQCTTEEDKIDFDAPIWTNPTAWAIALFNFVLVGFESSMSGWLKTYTGRIETSGTTDWFPPIFLYFLFFVAGRGVAPVFLRFLSDNVMLLTSSLMTLTGMSVLLFAENLQTLSVGAAIAGFGTSSVYPTNLSRFTKIFGASSTRRATPLFICGTLGAASTTWLIGFVSSRNENDLRSGMFVLLASVSLTIVLQIGLMSVGRRNSENKI